MGTKLATEMPSPPPPTPTPPPPPPPPPASLICKAMSKPNSVGPPPPPPPAYQNTSTAPSAKQVRVDLSAQLKKFRFDNTPQKTEPVPCPPVRLRRIGESPVDTNHINIDGDADARGLIEGAKMFIVSISDIHMNFERVVFPVTELDKAKKLAIPSALVVSGDFTNCGSESQVNKFNDWLKPQRQLFKYIIVICGNHEEIVGASKSPKEIRGMLSNATHYLHDSGCIVENIKFYGTPWTPDPFEIHGSPFYSLDEDREKTMGMIPDDTDYLVTHTPPRGILDNNHGCPPLMKKIRHLFKNGKLCAHQFGHVHQMYGWQRHNGVMFVNAAVDEDEQPFFFSIL